MRNLEDQGVPVREKYVMLVGLAGLRVAAIVFSFKFSIYKI